MSTCSRLISEHNLKILGSDYLENSRLLPVQDLRTSQPENPELAVSMFLKHLEALTPIVNAANCSILRVSHHQVYI